MRFDPKAYDTVDSRVKQFYEAYPAGRIATSLLSDPNDASQCVVQAFVFLDSQANSLPKASGLAQELAGKAGANQTAWVENCETSAIGRALANMGISGNLRASREEMQKTERVGGQNGPPQGNRPPANRPNGSQNNGFQNNGPENDGPRPQSAGRGAPSDDELTATLNQRSGR